MIVKRKNKIKNENDQNSINMQRKIDVEYLVVLDMRRCRD